MVHRGVRREGVSLSSGGATRGLYQYSINMKYKQAVFEVKGWLIQTVRFSFAFPSVTKETERAVETL